MNRNLIASACACLSMAWPHLAWSMDLLQAYQAAQSEDATILAARASTDANRERVPQAFAQLLPNVGINASHNNNNLTTVSPGFFGGESVTNARYFSSNQTFSVRQALYRPYAMAQYRQTQSQVDDAEASLAQDEQNLALRVGGAYFDALLADEQLALVLSQREALETQLNAANKMLTGGSGTRTDVDEAKARLDMNRAQELEARQNQSFTKQQLEVLVNGPVVSLARLNVNLLDLKATIGDDLPAWRQRTEDNSRELQALKARLESARQEVSKAKAGHLPTLDLIAQWTRSESESVTSVNTRYTNASLGVSLNVPLYSGGQVSATVRQARALEEQASQALEALRRDLGLRVHKEYRALTESIPRIKALEQALLSADQLVLSSRKSMAGGSRTLLDVLNAEQQRMQVRRDLANARYSYLMAQLRLQALAGSANEDAIRSINSLLNE